MTMIHHALATFYTLGHDEPVSHMHLGDYVLYLPVVLAVVAVGVAGYLFRSRLSRGLSSLCRVRRDKDA